MEIVEAVRAVREGMSRATRVGRLGVCVWEVVVEVGRERIVKDVRRGMGRSLKVFVGAELAGVVVELDAAIAVADVEEGDGEIERTIRLVIGSAV